MLTADQHFECARNLLTARNAIARVMHLAGVGRPAWDALESTWDRLRLRFDEDFPGERSPYTSTWVAP